MVALLNPSSTRASSSPDSSPLRTQKLPSSVRRNSRTKRGKHSALLPSPRCASLHPCAQERNVTPCFSNKSSLFHWSVSLQPVYLQSFSRSIKSEKTLTSMFPVASGLFVRSSTQERKLTHLFSGVCVRFCEKVGCPRNSSTLLTVNSQYEMVGAAMSKPKRHPSRKLAHPPAHFDHPRERLTSWTAIPSM